jgi:Na+/melibiose symporter-like transporter
MAEEVTKSCVRVLKAEREVRFFFRYILNALLTPVVKILVWITGLINWCILRALARWLGVPSIIIIALNALYTTVPYFADKNGMLLNFAWFMGHGILASIILVFTLYSWAEIPDAEKKILNGEDSINTQV